MITHMDVSLLSNYTASKGIAVSFYLNRSGNERNKTMWDIETKDLIKNARLSLREKRLENSGANHSYVEAAEKNLQQIHHLASMAGDPLVPVIPWHDRGNAAALHSAGSQRFKSLAIFADLSENFFQIYRLPAPVKSTITLGKSFYVRPLLAILKGHYRVALLLTDSRHARCFEIYMGESLEHLNFETKRPGLKKPLLETFMKRDKHIMQKKEEETRIHLLSVAEFLKTHFNLRHFDKLIIGARNPLGEHLARLLPGKLHDNLIGIFEIDIHADEKEVLAKALEAEKNFQLSDENKLLRKITDEIQRDGLAVKGIKSAVESIHDHNIRELAVADDFSIEGLVCTGCGMPHLKGKDTVVSACVACANPLVQAADLIYDIVAAAEHQGAAVRHIHGASLIASLENVAAITKFKKGGFVQTGETVGTGL